MPNASVAVVGEGRRLAVVSVSAPTGPVLLARLRKAALPDTGDVVALVQAGAVVDGPASLIGASLGQDKKVRSAERSYSAESVALPGYVPPARVVALTDGSRTEADLDALRRRLAITALISLVSICLYAAALARPLLRALNRVASVAEQALLDPLTNIANRRGFEGSLVAELERSERHGHPCALVIVDLDDFKQVNDTRGHDVGDEVLVTVASRLQTLVRSPDTVARLGGEEFALLLPETDFPGALIVAERARAALEAESIPMTRDGDVLRVTASFGVACFPASPDRAALLREADEALYAAKRLGKNRVVAAPRAAEAA